MNTVSFEQFVIDRSRRSSRELWEIWPYRVRFGPIFPLLTSKLTLSIPWRRWLPNFGNTDENASFDSGASSRMLSMQSMIRAEQVSRLNFGMRFEPTWTMMRLYRFVVVSSRNFLTTSRGRAPGRQLTVVSPPGLSTLTSKSRTSESPMTKRSSSIFGAITESAGSFEGKEVSFDGAASGAESTFCGSVVMFSILVYSSDMTRSFVASSSANYFCCAS